MKHAYLIIAHNQQSVLDTLLDLLDDARNDIFLHVDARSETLYAHAMERQMKRAGYLQISMGNHKVAMLPKREERSDIVVWHYNVRGRSQFMTKMINGGRQLEQHKGRHGGRHWRYFYALYKEGKLEAEYERVIGTATLDRLEADGYVVKDNVMPDIFKAQVLPAI